MAGPWENYQSAAPVASAGPWSKYESGTTPTAGPQDASAALSDPNWARKGRTIYKDQVGADFKGDDQAASKWLNDYLYNFNYRLVGIGAGNEGTIDTAYAIKNYSDEGKKAFLDAQTQFENMDTTFAGVGEATKRILSDPTTYVGLGVGKLFGLGASQATKQGIKESLKVAAKNTGKTAAVGAVEGGVYAGASDLAQQSAQINADGQEDIDYGRLGKSVGIGAGVGGVAGGVIGGALEAPQVARVANRLPTDNQDAAELLAQRLSSLEKAGEKLDLKDVERGAPDGAEAALSKTHTDIAEEIKADESILSSLLKDKTDPNYPRYQAALRSAKNKVKDFASDEDIAAIQSKVGHLQEGQRLVMNLRQSNELFNLTRQGVQGGISKYTDELNPFNFGAPNALGSGARALRTLATVGNYATTGPMGLAGQFAGVVAGRAVDAVTGRRSLVNLFVKQNASKRALEDIVPGFTNLPSHLQEGLKVAAEKKSREEADRALAAAEKLKIAEIKNRNKARKENIAEAKQSMRFQEFQLKQKERTEKAQQNEAAKAERTNIADAKRSMNFQWNMLAQRQLEEQRAAKAIADAEAAASRSQSKQEAEFNKAVAATNRVIRFREAMRKLKDKETAPQASKSVGLPPHGQSIGLAPNAPRKAKAEESIKNEAKKAEASANAHSKASQTTEEYPAPPRNSIAYQGGKDLIVGYQDEAKSFANSTPDKKLGDLIRKSVEKFERTRGRKRQSERMTIYREALEEAEKMDGDAFYYVDRYLEPLALVFEQPKGSK